MPNQVTGLAGWNCEVDGVKVNTDLIPEGTAYAVPNLNPATDYTGRIRFIPVDNAGNPGTPVAPTPAGAATTTMPSPDQVPMSAPKVAIVDGIVADAMKLAGHARGITVGIAGPDGFLIKSYGSSGAGTLTPAMHMRMGSISKTFTAEAIFREVDKATITLDDAVDTYVPGLPNPGVLTIRHLLMMQSGLVDDQTNTSLTLALVLSPTGSWSPDTSLAYIKSKPAAFTPGSAFQYTNSNYIVLGYVLKAVTGRTPKDVITNDILAPLGLTQTSWPASSALPTPFSHGYWNNPLVSSIPILGPILFSNDITNMNPEFFDAAGALVTDVNDGLAWCKEIRDGTLLSSTVQAARSTIASTGPGVQAFVGPHGPVIYDYGMGIYRIGSWLGHDGSVPGFDSAAMVLPGNGCVMFIIENQQTVAPTSPYVLIPLSYIWLRLAEAFYPGSTTNQDYAEGGPFTGPVSGRVPKPLASIVGQQYRPGAITLPFTLPGQFVSS